MLSRLSLLPQAKGRVHRRFQSWNRIAGDQALPVRQYMELEDSADIFVIGSCFANEIRAVLEQAGVTVHPRIDPGLHPLFPEDLKVAPSWGGWDERVHYQCYTPHSIRQEIDIALGRWTPSDDAIFEVRKGGVTRYWEPYRRAIHAASREDLLEIRRRMSAAQATGLARAKLVIVTLGLIESFRLLRHEGYAAEINPAFADETRLEQGGYAEALRDMEAVCEAILEADPEKTIVVTVSPIPLSRTFLDMDVVTATTRGKSILRAVADALEVKYAQVHYWPSYEYVMWSGRGFRDDDLRHVKADIVEEITGAFCRCYFRKSVAERAVWPHAATAAADVAAPPQPKSRKLGARLARKFKKLARSIG